MRHTSFRLVKKGVMGLFCSALILPTSVNSQSLEQAVAYTFDTHPDLRAAYTRFKVSEKQVEQAEAGYWPTINATAGIGYEYTDSPSTRRSSSDGTEELTRRELGISLKQELFSGFHTQSEVARTSYETSAEQWTLYSTAEDLALDVTKVYINLIKAEKLVALSEKNLASHQEIFNQIKLRTDSGFGSSADLSQINGRLANAQSNLIAAKNNLLDSEVAFYHLVEQRPENLMTPYPDSDFLPESAEEGLKIALRNHPVIKSASNDIASARAQYETSKSNYYPKVSFDVDANFDDNLDGEDGSGSPDVGGESNEVVAMIRLSYNLFSGGKDEAYAKETAYKMSEAKELNRSVHRQVTEGFTLSWNAFELLNLQKPYIQKHVIAAKESEVNYKEQFTIGQRSLLDLLDTENELYQARRDFLEAEFEEIIAQYRILHSMGVLVEALRVTRPSTWLGEKEFKGGVTQ